MQAEKSIADDEEEKVGIIAEEVSKKQKGWIAIRRLIPLHTTPITCTRSIYAW